MLQNVPIATNAHAPVPPAPSAHHNALDRIALSRPFQRKADFVFVARSAGRQTYPKRPTPILLPAAYGVGVILVEKARLTIIMVMNDAASENAVIFAVIPGQSPIHCGMWIAKLEMD